jgi:hypothetical protein
MANHDGGQGQERDIQYRALAQHVLAVATTRVDGWCAYIDAVPGHRHSEEYGEVLKHGDKLPEKVARALFPAYEEIPYAR